MPYEEYYPLSLRSIVYASLYGFFRLVKYFFINKQDSYLDMASYFGHNEIVKFFLFHQNRPTASHLTTSIHLAGRNGFLETVQILVEYSDLHYGPETFDLNKMAVRNNWISIFDFCIGREPIDWTNSLTLAIQDKNLEMVKFLLPKAVLDSRISLIELAVSENSVEIAEFLLVEGRFPVPFRKGLLVATQHQNLEMIKLLLDCGATLDLETIKWNLDQEQIEILNFINQYTSDL